MTNDHPGVTIEVQITVNEGYSDQRGPGRETIWRAMTLPAMPRVGEAILIGGVEAEVRAILWRPDKPPLVIVRDTFSLSDTLETAIGWFSNDE